LPPTGRVLGPWDIILDDQLESIYIYSPSETLPLASLLHFRGRIQYLLYVPWFLFFLFRVSTEYRYLLPLLNRCISPILVLSSAFLSFSPKLFSCFLCVLVITLLGRGLPCFGFFTVSLWYLACGFYFQMAMYVIGGYSVELPPSSRTQTPTSPPLRPLSSSFALVARVAKPQYLL